MVNVRPRKAVDKREALDLLFSSISEVLLSSLPYFVATPNPPDLRSQQHQRWSQEEP